MRQLPGSSSRPPAADNQGPNAAIQPGIIPEFIHRTQSSRPGFYVATLCPRAELAAVEEDGRLVVWTFENGVRRAQEIARRHIPPGSYTVDDFLGERREEAGRAERRFDSVDGEDRAAS
jgi:hypothetical protein